jgi:hypothetical protein
LLALCWTAAALLVYAMIDSAVFRPALWVVLGLIAVQRQRVTALARS